MFLEGEPLIEIKAQVSPVSLGFENRSANCVRTWAVVTAVRS